MAQQIGSHYLNDESPSSQVPAGTPSSGSTSSIANAGSDAMRTAIQIIQQATQGPQNPIVNRPQVIMPEPIKSKQYPTDTQPVGNVNATTRDGQKRNDMNNFLTGVGNVVKQGVNAKNEKSERDLMHDLAIIQAAASNPDDPHNRMILDGMAKDPKVVKRLQKALGYNPLGGEPPPPEAKTLQKFGAQVKAKEAIGAQGQGSTQTQQGVQSVNSLMSGSGGMPQGTSQGGAMGNLLNRMPNTQQINPMVSMQAELIKAGILPKNDMSPKVMLDYVTEVMKDETKREELKARAQATNNTAMMRLYDTVIRAQATMQRGKESDASKERIGADHDAAYKYGADQRFKAAETKAMKTDSTFKNLKIASDAYDKDIQRTEEQLSTLLKQKTIGGSAQEKGSDIDNSIMLKKQELDKYKSLKDTMTNMMKERLNIEPPSGGVEQLLQDDTPKEQDMNFGDLVFPKDEQQPQQ